MSTSVTSLTASGPPAIFAQHGDKIVRNEEAQRRALPFLLLEILSPEGAYARLVADHEDSSVARVKQ